MPSATAGTTAGRHRSSSCTGGRTSWLARWKSCGRNGASCRRRWFRPCGIAAARQPRRPEVYRGAVRHAREAALDELEPLLLQLRQLNELVERKRGVFYRRSKAFLHFHEDPSGLHADVRLASDFERFRVQTLAEQRELLKKVKSSLSGPS